MKLYARCKKCKSDIYLKTVASDRFKLAKKVGEKVRLQCESCGNEQMTSVNDIKAEENKMINLIGVLIFLIGTVVILILIWPYLNRSSSVYVISGLISPIIIPFMVYQGLHKSQYHRVHYFNIKIYG